MIGLDELKQYLDLPSGPHADDQIIEALERAAVQMVETATGYTYPDAGPVVEYLRGFGTTDLFLHTNPTSDPTEILERADAGDAGTAIAAAAANGWVRRGSMLVRKSGVWTRDYEYQVTYPGGFSEYPEDVRNAVMEITGILYRGRGHEGNLSESIGGYSYTKQPDAVRTVTDRLPQRLVFG